MRVDHLMYKKDFDLLTERLEKLAKSDVDEKIANFLRMVNFSHQLVTIFSCQGHDRSRKWNTGYVMFGVRSREHIEKLYELVRKEFGQSQHLVNLTMTTRLNVVSKKKVNTHNDWYAVWNLSWKHDKTVSREQGWMHLEKAGVNFLIWLKEQ